MRPSYSMHHLIGAYSRHVFKIWILFFTTVALAFSIGCGKKKGGKAGSPDAKDPDHKPPVCDNCPQDVSTRYFAAGLITVSGPGQLILEIFGEGDSSNVGSQSISVGGRGAVVAQGQLLLDGPINPEAKGTPWEKSCYIPQADYKVHTKKAGVWLDAYTFDGLILEASNKEFSFTLELGYDPLTWSGWRYPEVTTVTGNYNGPRTDLNGDPIDHLLMRTIRISRSDGTCPDGYALFYFDVDYF